MNDKKLLLFTTLAQAFVVIILVIFLVNTYKLRKLYLQDRAEYQQEKLAYKTAMEQYKKEYADYLKSYEKYKEEYADYLKSKVQYQQDYEKYKKDNKQ